MSRDRLGPIGGLAADRPLLTVILLSFGLTALSAFGALEPGLQASPSGVMANTLVTGLVLVAAPFFVIGVLPRSIGVRLAVAALIAITAGLALFTGYIPPFRSAPLQPAELAVFAVLAAFLLFGGRAFGAPLRFAFVAVAGALLGTAGALGVFARESVSVESGAGALAGLALAAGSVAGIAAICDFSVLFARGADQRRAAAISAQYSGASLVYAAMVAAAAIAIGYARPGNFNLIWLVGVGVALSATSSLFVCVGALSLRRSNESLAVEENTRRQSFRAFWRPFRSLLPPNAALAVVGIASIAVVAAAFNLNAPFPVWKLAFIIASALSAGLVFFSLRTGLFVFLQMIICGVFAAWIGETLSAPRLAPIDEAAALALSAILFGHLALSWRDARSPRLNPRETAEAAMTDALRLFILGAVVGVGAFFAAYESGIWPGGAAAGANVALVAILGLTLAPAIMTALSKAVRRETL